MCYSFAFTYYCHVVHIVTFISVIKGSFAMKFALFIVELCDLGVQSCHDLGKISQDPPN